MKPLDRRQFLRENAALAVGAAAALSGALRLAPGVSADPDAGTPSPAKPRTSGARAKGGAPREVKTGGSRMIPVDGKYRVWTKKVGTGPISVLTLHGGPGHLCMYDDQEAYFEGLLSFVRQVHAGTFKPSPKTP
jgi:hypothetical protein